MADYLLIVVEPRKNFFGNRKKTRAYGSKDQLIDAINDALKQGYFVSDMYMNGHDTSITLTKVNDSKEINEST
jgi:hypothetical protein